MRQAACVQRPRQLSAAALSTRRMSARCAARSTACSRRAAGRTRFPLPSPLPRLARKPSPAACARLPRASLVACCCATSPRTATQRCGRSSLCSATSAHLWRRRRCRPWPQPRLCRADSLLCWRLTRGCQRWRLTQTQLCGCACASSLHASPQPALPQLVLWRRRTCSAVCSLSWTAGSRRARTSWRRWRRWRLCLHWSSLPPPLQASERRRSVCYRVWSNWRPLQKARRR